MADVLYLWSADSAPSKFQFSGDRKTLTVSSVCKNNCSGPNDLMVIQCKASNIHGYVLANGYINVFGRFRLCFTASVILQCKKAWNRNSQIINHWPLVYYVKVEKNWCDEKVLILTIFRLLHTKTTHKLMIEKFQASFSAMCTLWQANLQRVSCENNYLVGNMLWIVVIYDLYKIFDGVKSCTSLSSFAWR